MPVLSLLRSGCLARGRAAAPLAFLHFRCSFARCPLLSAALVLHAPPFESLLDIERQFASALF